SRSRAAPTRFSATSSARRCSACPESPAMTATCRSIKPDATSAHRPHPVETTLPRVPEVPLTLMAVHAHPDDEAVSTGGVLARYADEGVRTVLVTCTDGRCG